MRTDMPLRPELASVCRFIAGRRDGRQVRSSFRPNLLELPARGILADLAAIKGLA